MSSLTEPTDRTAITDLTDLTALTPGVWTVDASHSSIEFVVRHMMVSKVRGRFGSVNGTITIAEDPVRSTLEATADVSSVTTGDEKRDEHLRSSDFFDAAHHPTITLVSTSIDKRGSGYVLHTELTIKGVTRPVDFELEFEGVSSDPWGGTRAGFSARTELNRRDWGLTWNVALETGGVDDLGVFSVGERPRPAPHSPGLYHLAWQVNTIEDLAAMRARLTAAGALVGESDHGVSKSLYAVDPDGIEFEVMWAVPRENWPEGPGTARLDLDAELARWTAVDTADQ
jgi:polyisoprenoid-binding protein YceI